MKRYDEYVDSNDAVWFSSVPTSWKSTKMRELFSERREKVSDKNYPALSVGKMGIVPQLETAVKTDNGDNRKLIRVGDFAINSRSDRKGAGGMSDYDGSASLIITVLKPHRELNKKFYHYLLRSHYFSEEYYRNGKGLVSDLWTTKWEEMRNIYIPVPPRDEQDQIVRFLDWKVSSISRLINLKRQKIIELESLKLRLITDVITKGLNTHVPLKNSSSKWIGNVPTYWNVIPIRRAYNVILGKMLASNSTTDADTLEEYVCAKDVHFDGVDLSNLKKMWYSPSEKEQYRIFNGDLLVVEGGAAGNAAIVNNINERNIYVQNSIHIIRAKDDTALNEYLCFWLLSLVKRGYMKCVCSVATIPHYTKDKVLATIMPLPPVHEQITVVNYLKEKCERIDTTIFLINNASEKLRELRMRLISDVVTGQIDVRGVKIPEYERCEEKLEDADAEPDAAKIEEQED